MHFPALQHIQDELKQVPHSSKRICILENISPEVLAEQIKNPIFVFTILRFFHNLAQREGN